MMTRQMDNARLHTEVIHICLLHETRPQLSNVSQSVTEHITNMQK